MDSPLPEADERPRVATQLVSVLNVLGAAAGLVFVWVLFAALKPEAFLSTQNQYVILSQTAVVAIAAVGATLIIISGGIDLSVGSTIALTTMVTAWLLNRDVPPLAAAGGGVLTGMVCGLAIGTMVIGHIGRLIAVVGGIALSAVLWRVAGPAVAVPVGIITIGGLIYANERLVRRITLSPFIVTLGMWGALRGLAKGLGANRPIYYMQETFLSPLMSPSSLEILGFTIPLPAPGVWVMLLAVLIVALAMHFTRFGRHIFAIGSSEETARLCGVHISFTKLLIYTVAIGFAGLAGVLQFSFLGQMGDPTTAMGMELQVIAAVVIGGASLSGGQGSVLGTLFGALIMTTVASGCTNLGLENWIQEVVTGGIIVVAVAIDRIRQRATLS